MKPADFLTLLAAVANFGIGFFVLTRNYKRPLYISFSAFSFVTAVWVSSNFLFAISPSRILLETQYSSGVLVIPIALIWFSIFLDGRIAKRTVFLLLLLSLILLVIPYYDSIIIDSLVFLGNHQYELHLGKFFDFYSFIPLTFFAALLFRLVSGYKKARGIKKVQLRYILAGVIGFGGISLLVSFILPFFNVSVVAPFDAQSSLIFVGFSLYAIIRHRLLDIRLVITRSLIYGILLSLVSLAFILITIVTAQFFGASATGRNTVSVLVAVLIVFGLDPLKRWLSRVTNNIFFKAKVDYAQLLQRLSNVISLELDLQKLIDDLEKGLINGIKVKSSLILLRDRDHGQTTGFRATIENDAAHRMITVDNNSPLVQFLREHRHLSLLEALERKIEDTPEGPARQKEESSKAEFERIGAGLIAPIFSEDHLVAILTLGPKLSGDSFSNEDIQLIDVLAPQIGSAIQKANLYEEVRQFSEGLKVKVEEATKELRDRNVSLQTLQTITKDITRTLDFGKVVQNIADAVSTDLGFLGAILVFLDDDGKTLRARAVTATPLTAKAIKLLPKPFTEYTTDYTTPEPKNLGVEVIRSGKVRFSDNLSEVISPPIPRPLATVIQKLMGIKTMILIPIVSEEKVIGAIEVGAKRRREEISQREIETLQSMADELGVVARNISLFDRIRKTNDQLEVANTHLQELDKAKSEFVSIASHQLRTPMTGIMGYLSMMTQGDFGKIKPEHQKILVDLLSESQRMIRLINQFLNVSKIEAGKFTYTWKQTQLEELVKHEVKEVEKAAKDKGLKLTVKFPATPLPVITADADKVEDVILNLLDNAIKYTAKGTVTATVSQADGLVKFAVKDSGIGIQPADAGELFNKFVRGSGIAQIHPDGSGLGLFIAKSIVDAHGGRIWAESEGEGQGSTFQFTLPLKPPTEAGAHPLSAAAHVVKPKDSLPSLQNE